MTRIVLTGATGFVGSEVLDHLIADPAVDGVSCLVRRPFTTTSTKVDSILVEDFTHYPENLLARLADHTGVIWALGGKDSDTRDAALYTRITHDFTLAFASALAARTDRLTFCYLSGAGADPSESSRLPWEKVTRHIKGRTEKDLHALAARHPGLAVRCFRPGGILPRSTHAALTWLAAPISIRVDRLADALVVGATADRPDLSDLVPAVVSNAAAKRIARQVRGPRT